MGRRLDSLNRENISRTLLFVKNQLWHTVHYYYSGPNISDSERAGAYNRCMKSGLTTFSIFALVTSSFMTTIGAPFLTLGWENINFWYLLLAYVVSRVADIVSTIIALGGDGVELNPDSDPHDISKTIPSQIVRMIALSIAAFLLGLVSKSLGHGLLVTLVLIGVHAAIVNSVQKKNPIHFSLDLAIRSLQTLHIKTAIVLCIAIFIIFKIYFPM